MTVVNNSSAAPAYLIDKARVFDGSGAASREMPVLLQGELIAAVGAAAREQAQQIDGLVSLDASGCTLMPGLIDSHCHISFDQPTSNDELFFHRRAGLATLVAAVNAQKVLRAGVTSFFDANCIFDVGIDLRDAIEGGVVEGPRMATGGNVLITSVGGTAGRLLPDSGKRGYAVIVETPEDMIREVRRQVKAGVDWIKVHVSGLPTRGKQQGEIQAWSLDELRLVCDTAHNLGVPVVGHCRNPSSTRDAARAGMDMILHATFMDEEALQAVVDAQVPLVPTLTFQANLADFGDRVGADPALRQIFRDEIAQSAVMFRRAYDAGVPLICGSESGFSLTPYGDWHYREMEIFVEHLGLTPLQAMHCATQAGARSLGLEGRLGCIAAGYLADVLVVEGDPTGDLELLGQRDKFRHLFKAGKPVDLQKELPESWRLPGWRVGQFSTQILHKTLTQNLD